MNISARKFFFSGFTLWSLVVVVSLFVIFPLRQKLRFGIDIVGGTYITLEVQTDKAVEAELVSIMQSSVNKLKTAKKAIPTTSSVDKNVLTMSFDNQQKAEDAAGFLRDTLAGSQRGLVMNMDAATVSVRFTEQREEKIKRDAVLSNITVLRARLDKDSVAEISIMPHGDKHIIVELPDVADPLEAKAMIGKAAKLEFRLVEREGASKEDIEYDLGGVVPSDKEIVPDSENDNLFYLVNRYAEVTGAHLKDARAGTGGDAGYEAVVHFSFNQEGGQKFYALTSKNINKRLAILLDGKVITAPNIQSAIRESGQISGMHSIQEAKTTAALLKSGAFVAPVTFEEERQTGPLLGEQSIRQGVMACLVALMLLLVICVVVYKWSGLLAFLVLLINLLLLLVGMVWLHATLTLPGLGGMILTVGMAIDASILIFEHIRDQISMGVTAKKAVDAGFAGAMRVILDANITTFIAGAVLYQFGSGPIQGFAITLMFGIASTLLTGLFCLKMLFNFFLNVLKVEKLSI
jgi:preprotein translocase subunit SecD